MQCYIDFLEAQKNFRKIDNSDVNKLKVMLCTSFILSDLIDLLTNNLSRADTEKLIHNFKSFAIQSFQNAMKMLHKTAILKTTAIKHTAHKTKITPAEQQNFVGQTQESKTQKNVCSKFSAHKVEKHHKNKFCKHYAQHIYAQTM